MADDPTKTGDPAKGDPPEPSTELGDAGKKALDDERKARREAERKLKEAADQLKELQDKDKTEIDKLRDENADLKNKLSASDAKSLRADVAMSKGLTAAQAKRLVGTTQEELEADADEILTAFPSQSGGGATPPPSKKPAPDLKGGSEPNDDSVEMNPAKLAESVPRY